MRHADTHSAIRRRLVVHVAGEIASARDVSERSWQKINKRTVVRDFHGAGRRVKPDVRRQLHASQAVPEAILAHVVVVTGHKMPSNC
jgi:hypothetical protein